MIFGKWDERAAYSRQSAPVPVGAPQIPVPGPGHGALPAASPIETKQGTP
jgi:hypothetical protein